MGVSHRQLAKSVVTDILADGRKMGWVFLKTYKWRGQEFVGKRTVEKLTFGVWLWEWQGDRRPCRDIKELIILQNVRQV